VEEELVIDALDYLLHSRESVGGGLQVGGSHLLPLLKTHLLVTVEAVLLAALVAVPAAVWLAQRGRGQLMASTLANVGRAVPTFAVLAISSVYIGYNTSNLVIAMALLALPPLFTNAYVGVRQVDPDVVDAARGMGMAPVEIARRIQLPLAAPLVFGGLRTSTVNVLATATLGPYFGVATLGEPIISANVHGDDGRLGTAILVAALAVAAELCLASVQRGMTPRGLKLERPKRRSPMKFRTATTAALAVLALGLAACGDDDKDSSGSGGSTAATTAEGGKLIQRNAENAKKPTITVGSKNFTEEYILGEIYAQALQAAGYKVKKQLNLGSEQIALKAVKAGRIDGYPEYTGTALISFFKVKTDDVPRDPERAYQDTKNNLAAQNIVAFAHTPFTNSNGFAMTREGAQKAGGATKLSDLVDDAPSLTLSGGPECAQRTDCKLGLEQTYGLKFKKFVSIDLAKRHEILKSGKSDVGLVFTTDGQIKAEDLVLLEDDKQLFPPYNASFIVRRKAVDEAGADMKNAIEKVQQGLTNEVMQELNSRVDLDKEKPAQVAAEYLREAGYVK
jgi:glycine betaine/choline ABC-type transport system substrate-binding protein/ABC-type proline/glycine betaine transport system permease subunit